MDCAGGGTLNCESRGRRSYYFFRLPNRAEDTSHHYCTHSDHSTCGCTNERTLTRVPQCGLKAASVTTEYLELRDRLDSKSELTPILE